MKWHRIAGVLLAFATAQAASLVIAEDEDSAAIALAPADPTVEVAEPVAPPELTPIEAEKPSTPPPSLAKSFFQGPPLAPFSLVKRQTSPPIATEGIRPAEATLQPIDPSLGATDGEHVVDSYGYWPSLGTNWTVDLDVVYLKRSAPKAARLAETNPGIEPDARNLTFDFESGPRFALIRRGVSGWDVELNYFGIEGYHSPLAMPGATGPRIPGNDPADIFLPNVTGFWVDYRSRLHSEEINLRHAWGEYWTALVGVRAVQVHEDFTTIADIAQIPAYSIATSNRLYGLQIGGEGRVFCVGPLTISTSIKAGLFDNNAEQATVDLSGFLATSPTNRELLASTNQASFLGEIGITGSYQVTETIFIRGGYQWLWITDLALATDQLAVNDFNTNPTPFPPNTALRGITSHSGLNYHGAMIGVELTW